MKKGSYIEVIVGLIISVVIVIIIIMAIDRADRSMYEEDINRINKSINMAAINCYSIEGSYPDSLDYLIDNYGLIIDSDKYNVFYEVQASNISPTVRVTRKE